MNETDQVVEEMLPSIEGKMVAYSSAMLPIYQMKIEALATEERDIGIAETAVLKAIEAGLARSEEVESFLGVESTYFNYVVRLMEQEGLLEEHGSPSYLVLTEKGREALAAGRMAIDQIVEMRVFFDPITRSFLAPEHHPVHPSEAGKSVVLGERLAAPATEAELDLGAIRRAQKGTKSAMGRILKELVRVTSVTESKVRYWPSVAIIVKHEASSDMKLRLVVDGTLDKARANAIENSQDGVLRRSIEKCRDDAGRTEFSATAMGFATSAAKDRLAGHRRSRINLNVRRTPIANAVEEKPSTTNRVALQEFDEQNRLATEAAAIQAGEVFENLVVAQKVITAITSSTHHLLMIVPGHILDFPLHYRQLLLAAKSRGVAITIAQCKSALQDNGATPPKSQLVELRKSEDYAYWQAIDYPAALFSISWDAKHLLLTSRPPIDVFGHAPVLAPLLGVVFDERASVEMYYDVYPEEVKKWALNKREIRRTLRRNQPPRTSKQGKAGFRASSRPAPKGKQKRKP
jgi:hypothetical protein